MPPRRVLKAQHPDFPRTRVFLFRHPQVVGFDQGKVWGHSDVHLTRMGKRQIGRIVARMEDERLDGVYSSDLSRTRQVAELVARRKRRVVKARAISALREVSLGKWEGMTIKEINEKFPGELAKRQADLADFRPPAGESLKDVAARAMPAFVDIVKSHKNGNICIVAHAGVNRLIICRLLDIPLANLYRIEQGFACLNIIDIFEDGIPLLKSLNQELPESEEESRA